jgi:hypothetical protein
MKLNDVSVDPVRVEQGEWIGEKYGTPIPEMGDLCVKVRGNGNADWRRAQSKLIAALPRNKRVGGQIDSDEIDRINSTLLLEHSLLDWGGIDDEAGNPVSYSKAQAKEILSNPTHRRVRDAIFWAASTVGDGIAEKKEDQAKN